MLTPGGRRSTAAPTAGGAGASVAALAAWPGPPARAAVSTELCTEHSGLVIRPPAGWHDVTRYRWAHAADGESVSIHLHRAGDAVDAASACLAATVRRMLDAAPGSTVGPVETRSIQGRPAAVAVVAPPEDLAEVLPVQRLLAWSVDEMRCLLFVHAAPATLREASAHFEALVAGTRRGSGAAPSERAASGRKVSLAGIQTVVPDQLRGPTAWALRGDGEAGLFAVEVVDEPHRLPPPPAAAWAALGLDGPQAGVRVTAISTPIGGGRQIAREIGVQGARRAERLADIVADDGFRVLLRFGAPMTGREDAMWNTLVRAVARRVEPEFAAIQRGAAPGVSGRSGAAAAAAGAES